MKEVADVTISNRKRKDWMLCVVEDMTKFYIARDGWTTTAVKEEAEWFDSVEDGAEGVMKEWYRSGSSNTTCENPNYEIT